MLSNQNPANNEHHLAFAKRFRNKVEEVIAPSFDRCVRSLQQYGIRAQQANHMNWRHPNVSLDIEYNPQNYCRFVLSPMETEEKVGMRIMICRHNVWNDQDTTRVEVDQVTEALLREKLQDAISALDDE